jgi:hypothetical protein
MNDLVFECRHNRQTKIGAFSFSCPAIQVCHISKPIKRDASFTVLSRNGNDCIVYNIAYKCNLTFECSKLARYRMKNGAS